MGFSNTLKRNAVNEWKDYYVDYDKLKTRIKNRDFKSMLYAEVNKINSFYFLLEKKAMNEKNHLFNEILPEVPRDEIDEIKTQESENDDVKAVVENFGKSTNESGNENATTVEENILSKYLPLKKGYTKRKKEKFITEFLHSLVKIKAYRDLNSSGLIKLARKYATVFQNEVFFNKFNLKLKETYFFNSKRVDSIRVLVKKTYKKTFAKDQPEKAKTIFKRLGSGSKSLDIYYILSGFFSGISLTMAFLLFREQEDLIVLKFMCGLNGFYLGFLLFGICLKIFKFYSINYKFIFNFDVVSSMNNSIYLLFVSSLLLIANFMYYFKDSLASIDIVDYIPLIPIIFIFNPFDFLCRNSRIYLVTSLSKGLIMPISTIRFRHFYFVDVLQSFKFPIDSVILYYFAENPKKNLFSKYLYLLFPAIRILQCVKRYFSSRLLFPHIANAGKYSLGFLFLSLEILETHNNLQENRNEFIFNNLKYFITPLKFMSSIASFSWDILIDWVILRNRYTFPKSFYLIAVICNFFIRFYWTAPVLADSLAIDDKYKPKSNVIVESFVEIIRRFVWTLIRVEVEHLNNCDELKVKKSINLTSGEFFYKRDSVVKNEMMNEETEPETEFETEMEGDSGEVEEKVKNPEESSAEDESLEEHEEDTSSSKDSSELENNQHSV